MKILLLTQWFDPEPTARGVAFAKALAGLGHDVEVLTGFPNYPGGKVYDGYRIRLRQRERVDGISVVRVPLYPSHDTSSTRRALNYVSFAISAATLGAASVKRPDVVYLYHPPPTVGLAALVLSAFYRCPFVYDIQDLWPDTVASSGMLRSNWAHRALDHWCRLLYRRASRIVVLSPGFKRILHQRGVPAEKIEVIYNWCDEKSVCATRPGSSRDRFGMGDRFNVVFAGTMGKVQALDSVLEAAKLTAGRLPAVQFVFIGGGIEVPRLKQKAASMGLANVRFLPPLPPNQIGAVLELADVLLVHLADQPLFRITIPSKIQAYMATGRPILGGVKGDAASLIERAGCGMTCAPQSPASLALAVERLATMEPAALHALGENGRAFYRESLSLQRGVREFERVFQSVRRGGRVRPDAAQAIHGNAHETLRG
jgi:colanic acid biosynthesis glycosyl transferase WcaI